MIMNLIKPVVPCEEWPVLVTLDHPNLPHLDIKNIPAWAGEYARALSTATETPPELAAGMVLTACATAVARSMRVMVKPGYYEPCNIWAVVALPSGNRKSAVQSAAVAPLIQWERLQAERLEPKIERIRSERKTMEAKIKVIRARSAKEKDQYKAEALAMQVVELESNLPIIPALPRLWTSDATPERMGSMLGEQKECMAWLSSEGGVFELLQGRYSNGIPNLDLVLKAHSGDADRLDRGGRPTVFLQYPRLTIGLSPQPSVLRGLANKPGFRGRGLLARFLYLLPPSGLGYRTLSAAPIPDIIRAAYTSGVLAMLEWQTIPGEKGKAGLHTLELSDEAANKYNEFAHYVEVLMRPGNDMEHFTDWAGKAPGAAVRIAGVLHAIKHAHSKPWMTLIAVDTMNEALEIMAVIMRHSLAALDIMGADPSIAAARHVWEWVERGKQREFTVRDAFNALRGSFPRVKNLDDALEPLEERGYIQVIKPSSDGPGRPPSRRVMVRPELCEEW